METQSSTGSQGDAQLTEVAMRIREIMRGHGLSRALEIGQLILERFYGGDEREWRARRIKKNNSIRSLAARKDCPLGKSALNEAVGVYTAVRSLPFVHEARHIGAGHVAVVLRLGQEEREYWLRRAELEGLSVRRLRGLVILNRRAQGERRGRPELTAVARVRSRVRESLKVLQCALDHINLKVSHDKKEMDLLFAELEQVSTLCARALRLSRVGPHALSEHVSLDSTFPSATITARAG